MRYIATLKGNKDKVLVTHPNFKEYQKIKIRETETYLLSENDILKLDDRFQLVPVSLYS